MSVMTYAHLGRSGLLVSRIGLGTMNFGFTADESSSFAVMDAAIDAGINFFDTADVYGGPQSPDMDKGYGISEETIGRWLQRSGRRDDIVLATKVYQPMGLGPNDRRLSAYHIRRACEASLRRLQTDHIDLYQMHHVDRATPWEEIWQAMEQLVREGKISYVGSSNFAAWDVALAQSAASARHFMGLTSEQSLYNLAVRAVELELIPALRSLGIGLIPYSPLHAGLLAGALQAATKDASEGAAAERRAHRDQLEAYEELCRELGAAPADVALAWLLRNPVVSTTIVGAMTIEELHVEPRRAVGAVGRRGRRTTRPRSGRGRAKPRRPTPGSASRHPLSRRTRRSLRRHSGALAQTSCPSPGGSEGPEENTRCTSGVSVRLASHERPTARLFEVPHPHVLTRRGWANTDRGDDSHESNRGDGRGCGNSRDDAGGAARAAGSDKRRHRSDSCVGIRPD